MAREHCNHMVKETARKDFYYQDNKLNFRYKIKIRRIETRIRN